MHIGKKIHEEMVRQEFDVSDIAREIGCCRTNIYKIFARESINTDMLIRLSIALNHNFLSDIAIEVEGLLNTNEQ